MTTDLPSWLMLSSHLHRLEYHGQTEALVSGAQSSACDTCLHEGLAWNTASVNSLEHSWTYKDYVLPNDQEDAVAGGQ